MEERQNSLEHLLELKHIRSNFGIKEAFYYDLNKTADDIISISSSFLFPLVMKSYFVSSFIYYKLKSRSFRD